MTRVLPLWAHHALLALVAGALGACVGILLAPDKSIHTLAYCSIEASGTPGTPPCPPDTNRPVWATWAVWEGGVRAIATYDGRAWVLTNPVLGITRTTTPPTSWSEL